MLAGVLHYATCIFPTLYIFLKKKYLPDSQFQIQDCSFSPLLRLQKKSKWGFVDKYLKESAKYFFSNKCLPCSVGVNFTQATRLKLFLNKLPLCQLCYVIPDLTRNPSWYCQIVCEYRIPAFAGMAIWSVTKYAWYGTSLEAVHFL